MRYYVMLDHAMIFELEDEYKLLSISLFPKLKADAQNKRLSKLLKAINRNEVIDVKMEALS